MRVCCVVCVRVWCVACRGLGLHPGELATEDVCMCHKVSVWYSNIQKCWKKDGFRDFLEMWWTFSQYLWMVSKHKHILMDRKPGILRVWLENRVLHTVHCWYWFLSLKRWHLAVVLIVEFTISYLLWILSSLWQLFLWGRKYILFTLVSKNISYLFVVPKNISYLFGGSEKYIEPFLWLRKVYRTFFVPKP